MMLSSCQTSRLHTGPVFGDRPNTERRPSLSHSCETEDQATAWITAASPRRGETIAPHRYSRSTALTVATRGQHVHSMYYG